MKERPAGTITELNVYPVKSMKGLSLSSWPVLANGLAFDRRWMIVDHDGAQVTQREAPRLCLVTPGLVSAGAEHDTPTATHLTLTAPGVGSVTLPVDAAGQQIEVSVWDDNATAICSAPEVDVWLSDFLERDVRVVRFGEVGEVQGRLWQRVAFPDSLPFLLIGQGSLDDLNGRLTVAGSPAVEMKRFRPNLVVSGSEPFAEDGWRRLTIGELGFSVAKPCARCMITTIDQATAAVGREPLRTLAGYRTAAHGVSQSGAPKWGVMFGQKLIHHELGTLTLGDRVSVLEDVPAGDGLRFKAPARGPTE